MKKPASVLDTLSDEEMAAVVQRIVYLRTEILGYSQTEFAEKLHISQSYLSMLESGKKPLTKYAYEKMLATFDLIPGWLLYGEPDQLFVDRTEDAAIAEQFSRWYASLPVSEQSSIARAVQSIYTVVKAYPPGS